MSRAKRGHKKQFHNFLAFPKKAIFSEEWKKLGPAAKILYFYLKAKYNGFNNGSIQLHYSELDGIKGLSSSSTISGAFQELLDKGWITRTRVGGLYRYSNNYELTGRLDDCL